MIEQIMNLYVYRSDTQSSSHLSPLPPQPSSSSSSPLATPPSSSSGPFLFGHQTPTPLLPDTPLMSSPFPPEPPMCLPYTPSSGPFIFSAGVPPPLSPSPSAPFIFPPPLSPSPLLTLLPDTPSSSSPFISFSAGVPPPPLLQSGTTPSPGPFIFPASVPPPLSPSPLWRPGQLFPQSRPRLRPRRRRRRNEEGSDQASQISQVTSLGQSTLTETQIWEALDKLKNQVYTGEACAICLEYFVPKEEVSVTPCNHMFHEECLVSWVMQKGQCPHCRFVLFESTRNQ